MKPTDIKSQSRDIAHRLSSVHVLIVDQDHRIAMLIRNVLRSLGFTHITLSRDGSQALQLLRTEKVDMVITDWRMEPMDGIDLVKFLRTSDESPNRLIPIIMLTGNAEREHVETARDVGVTEYVAKPFSAKTLCNRIVLLIENPRSFIMTRRFVGPDRRRHEAKPPDGREKRT